MTSDTNSKSIYGKCNYGKRNYSKYIYGKNIMANVTSRRVGVFTVQNVV